MVRRYRTDPSARELFWTQLDSYVSAGGDLNDVNVTAIPLRVTPEVERLRREVIDLRARLDLAEDATSHDWKEFWQLATKKRYTTLELLAGAVEKSVSYLKECKTTGFVPAICFYLLRHSLARPMPKRATKSTVDPDLADDEPGLVPRSSDPDYRDKLRESQAKHHYPAFREWVFAEKAKLKPNGFIIGQLFCTKKEIDEGTATNLKKMFIKEFPEDAFLFVFKQPTPRRHKRKSKS